MKQIAWIEDYTDVIYAVVEQLEHDGFKIHTFKDYSSALSNIEFILTCDLIILDLILPPGNNNESLGYKEYLGVKFLEYLRINKGSKIPVVIFSVVAHLESVGEQLKQFESTILVSKPIRTSELRKEVIALLEDE
jgi:CheY-like chemotaxis protein